MIQKVNTQILSNVIQILSEILDVDEDQIENETYLIRELDAESIDLLEAALELSNAFETDIKEEDLFLRNLRVLLEQAKENHLDPVEFISKELPHIEPSRLAAMLKDLDQGPVLQVGDIVSYIQFALGDNHAA